MKLIVAGGGTGGHLFPGIAVAEEFLSRSTDNQVLFVGSEQGIEARTIPQLGYELELISAAGIRGKGSLAKLKGAAMLLYGYSQSRKILKKFRPDLVLGVGGYASLPMVMAANGLGIATYIHEQNALPGMANQVLSKVAREVFISLEESARFFPIQKILLTGNPLRRQILDKLGDQVSEQKEQTGFNLFIFGGSQGARTLNNLLPTALSQLEPALLQQLKVVHQTGEADFNQVQQAYRQFGIGADVRPFINDMAVQYQRSDLIICRAGATTIAEVTAMGKACLFVPFPHATDDHQRKNAEALLKKGACEMLLERELGDGGLTRAISNLMQDSDRLEQIGQQARGLARIDAARLIVDEMLGVARVEPLAGQAVTPATENKEDTE